MRVKDRLWDRKKEEACEGKEVCKGNVRHI